MHVWILVWSSWPLVKKDAGISGNPTLQAGGEHEAVTVPAPGEGKVSVQDCVQPVDTPTA